MHFAPSLCPLLHHVYLNFLSLWSFFSASPFFSLHTDTPRGFRGGAVPYPGSEQPPKETHRRDSQWDDEGPEWFQHHRWKPRHQAGGWRKEWCTLILAKVRFKMFLLLELKGQCFESAQMCVVLHIPVVENYNRTGNDSSLEFAYSPCVDRRGRARRSMDDYTYQCGCFGRFTGSHVMVSYITIFL